MISLCFSSIDFIEYCGGIGGFFFFLVIGGGGNGIGNGYISSNETCDGFLFEDIFLRI
jgi:hypothetical protein